MGIFPSQPPIMETEDVPELFDCRWFGHEIFTGNQPPTNLVHEIQSESAKPEISCLPMVLDRSRSEDLSFQTSFKSDSNSPKSVCVASKLQPTLSGKEVVEVAESITKQEKIERHVKKRRDMRGRPRKSNSKSLSNLEFEELKGFLDLGFVFTEEDKDSELVSIIPGLHRLGKKSDEKGTTVDDESAIPRPYLSEAWDVLDRTREENPLLKWRIPALYNKMDMKDHLRSWAHTVASTVR